MAENRYKLIKQGLPGPRSFEQRDLSDEDVPVWNATTERWDTRTVAAISPNDHGSLAGLSDDDHAQYLLVDGTRALTGTISGITATDPTHLVRKDYVDSLVVIALPASAITYIPTGNVYLLSAEVQSALDEADSQLGVNAASIVTNAGNISTNTTNIGTNTVNIATNVTGIATNVTNISTNATNIATNTAALLDRVLKAGDVMTGQLKGITPVAAADLTRKDYVDSLVVTTLPSTSIVYTPTGNTYLLGTNVQTALDQTDAQLIDNASSISTNAGNISTNTTNIATNVTNIGTNTTNISTNASNIALRVLKSGDTMTGQLSGITPTSAAHLTRKDYVDSAAAAPALDGLTDVTTTGVSTGDILYKSSGDWVDSNAINVSPSGAVNLKYNGSNTTRTATAANGGLEANNTDTGAGWERVLTESDVATNTTIRPDITYVTPSAHNSAFILSDGKLYTTAGNSTGYSNRTTGRGPDGSICSYGCDNFREISIPSVSPIAKAGNANGYVVAWALTEAGELFTWGLNTRGQCGLGHTSSVVYPELAETGVTEVYEHATNGGAGVGDCRLFIKKTDNFIYGCGYNTYGALGLGTTSSAVTTFTKITALGTAVTSLYNMGAKYGITVAQKSDDTIWVCGYGAYGQLGNSSTTAANSSFVGVTTPWGGGTGYVLQDVVGGYGYFDGTEYGRGFTGMFLDNGTTSVFRTSGYNASGQLGDTTTTQRTSPVTPNIGGVRLNSIASGGAGLAAVFAVQTNDNLWGWGYNGHGQLGNGTTTNSTTPVVLHADVGSVFSRGFCSSEYGYRIPTIYNRTGGVLKAMGYNGTYQVGTGSTSTNITSPVTVKIPLYATVTSVGSFCTQGSGRTLIAVTDENMIYVWGDNLNAGAHEGNSNQARVPMQTVLKQ